MNTLKLPKELEPLAQEARKYKSAEKFVKAYPRLFDKLQEKGIITDSFTTGQAMIRTFGTGKAGLIKFYEEVNNN